MKEINNEVQKETNKIHNETQMEVWKEVSNEVWIYFQKEIRAGVENGVYDEVHIPINSQLQRKFKNPIF